MRQKRSEVDESWRAVENVNGEFHPAGMCAIRAVPFRIQRLTSGTTATDGTVSLK